MAVLKGHGDRVFSANFSKDGARLVTASADGTARVWDPASGIEIATLAGSDNIGVARFSSDGVRVIGPSDDGLRVWDVASSYSRVMKPRREREFRGFRRGWNARLHRLFRWGPLMGRRIRQATWPFRAGREQRRKGVGSVQS